MSREEQQTRLDCGARPHAAHEIAFRASQPTTAPVVPKTRANVARLTSDPVHVSCYCQVALFLSCSVCQAHATESAGRQADAAP
jgi:hypothetical protein